MRQRVRQPGDSRAEHEGCKAMGGVWASAGNRTPRAGRGGTREEASSKGVGLGKREFEETSEKEGTGK